MLLVNRRAYYVKHSVRFARLRKRAILGSQMVHTDARTPGQLIGELLRARGWTNRVLGMVLGLTDAVISKLVGDKRPVDAAMALALEEVFGVPAERFVELQSQYDLARARIEARPDPKRVLRARIYANLPVPEMVRRGWIDAEDTRDPEIVEKALCRFFRVNRLEDASAFSHAAKKTDASDPASPAQLAWLHRVKTIASEMLIGSYSPAKLDEAIQKISALRRIRSTWSECPEYLRRRAFVSL